MLKSIRILLSTLLLTLFFMTFVRADCPVGDLTGDCKVGLEDLQILAEQWLLPPETPPRRADLNGDDRVDGRDLTMLATGWHQAGIPLAINEVLASNSSGMLDPQGEYDDWIELHNYGDEAIDVGGMYLTDDLDNPTMWRIPDDNPSATTIPANEFLLIWADNDTADPGLHMNFKLDADGEELTLFDTDGSSLIDSLSFGRQSADISYGHFPDASDKLRLMAFPTPLGPNIGLYLGFMPELEFSHDRGFYDAPFHLTIATETEDAIIYYTLDGSEPYQIGGRFPTGRVYTGPIPISKTTCIRAKAIKFGWMPSRVATCTYIFINDVIRQSPNGETPGSGWPTGSVNGQVMNYGMDPDVVNDSRYRDLIDGALLSIPSISLVTDLANLFDSSQGIYVNAGRDGRAWERPTSVELLNPDGSEGFQIDAGMRIRGGFSVSGSNPKHAFRLFFRGEYGDAKLRYPLFGNEGVDEFENIDLRTSQNYSWAFQGDSRNTMVREVFSRDLQGEMGHAYTRSRYYHLYINGHYWGLFQTQERSEASYAESYFGGDQDDYDVAKVSWRIGRGMLATDGNLDAYRRLYDATVAGLTDNEAYYRVQGLNPDGTPNPSYEKLLDVDNLIDFMIIEYYTGDRDGPGSRYGNIPNNTFSIYNRSNPDGWKWFQHDSEHSLGTGENNLVTPLTSAGAQWKYFNPHWLHEQLTRNLNYRQRFGDRVQKHLFNGGLLTREVAIARIDKRAAQIDLAIIAESARWGDSKRSSPYTKSHWLSAVQQVRNWISSRNSTLLGQFRGQNWFPSINAPTFNQNGGLVYKGFALQMVTATGDIHYTLDGSDPRLPQTSGGTTISTTTLAPENAAKRVLVPTGPISDDWKGGGAFDDSAWTPSTGRPGGVGYERGSGSYEALISIDVGDQMYNKNASCYIRIPFTVDADDLAGFNFMTLEIRYDDAFVAYINGVEVDRRNFTGTPAWNSNASASNDDSAAVMFESVGISDHIGDLRSGNNILAIHGLNVSTTSSDLLISVKLIAGKSSSPGGTGISPTAIEYTGPITLTETTQVKARALSGSMWSALNDAIFAIGPVAESLRTTEIMYHPQDTNDPNDPNEEFIELQNIGIETINLNLVRFTNGVDFTFPSMELAGGEYVLVVKDVNAFAAQYGIGFNIAGQYSGSLRNGGERVELQDAAGQTILNFRYRDGWYDITDGMGFSLTVKDAVNTEPNAWDDKSTWRPSANIGGSPGWDDTDEVPALGSVKINEILAHAHAEAPDWIELHNTTGEPIHIGGWFLSDDNDDLMKYQIADGTWIDPCGYIVFYQNQHFGNIVDPGCHSSFALSENGETLYLHSGRDGVLTGYSEEEKFDASETGVAFGRYKKSTGTYNFVAMSENTPGSANAYPKVGPIVINEIMYHPHNDGDAEYVELLNISGGPIDLQEWDNQQDRFVPWRFTDEGGISFDFPLGTTMTAGEYILLVRNVSAFESQFGAVGGGVQVFEWELGKLDNGSEKIQLSKPGDEVEGTRYYIRVDRVNYSDGSHPVGGDPWPTEPDGAGSSLVRKEPEDYGNDVINWKAASPSPGAS